MITENQLLVLLKHCLGVQSFWINVQKNAIGDNSIKAKEEYDKASNYIKYYGTMYNFLQSLQSSETPEIVTHIAELVLFLSVKNKTEQ
jgi:hypothetical protein